MEYKNNYDTELVLEDVELIIHKQNEFYKTLETKNIDFRKKALLKLKSSIQKYEKEIKYSLKKDLGKSDFESYTTEIGFVYRSIDIAIKSIRKWSKDKKVKTPLFLQPSKSKIIREPYGSILIIGPYNYPFQLIMEPLIGAIAAGNCVVLKPSEIASNTSSIIYKIIEDAFNEEYVKCVCGGVETTTSLINSKFDYIFFTGSERVGKIVMSAASNNLIPVTLELGGKSPVIVDKDVNIKVATQRIIWGKVMNVGQTCVAPDYIMIHKSRKEEFILEIKNVLNNFFKGDIKENDDYGRIINKAHFNRISNIIEEERANILIGGDYDRNSLYIEPTIIDVKDIDSASMKEELFGPVLPIIEYEDLDMCIDFINSKSKPLALYIFTENKDVENKIINTTSSGGVCVNDVISHIVNDNLPFGGVGLSGIGSYHGEYSYKLFSHEKSILKKSNKINHTLSYPPYTDKKLSLVKKFMK